ncbi:Histidine phosphatase superfamily,Histidine phosphatase superfamily, clade-2 [Cinara cedri]|uniref:acid phosphatase n=1 Tax=Cinara cedri TaxID=506608 RepID=A0A5E4MC52_9HEMI|nr:Histidine phosphatase superfamily,Histidine phosphatase superfamily, clade-2 [Cinara cedri]
MAPGNNLNNSNNVILPKKKAFYLKQEKKGAFAAVLISGIIIAIFVVYYSILGQESRKKNSLQLIIAVFRQGDRSPLKWETYPNDMYPPMGEGLWPDGLGQLTNAGKLKSYEFGKLFRKRYTKFLPVAYNSNLFHIKSTEFDRTEMTASVFLAGLFPPPENQIWNKDLLWTPVPIYSISPNEDNILRVTKPCPVYNVEFEKAKNATEKQMLFKYKTFFSYLSNHTGMEIQHLSDVENIFNSLTIQQRNHLTLPSWIKVKNYMDFMEEIVLEWLITYSKTDLMKKLRSGKLIGEIVRLMRDKMDGRLNPDRKMFAYFSHEQTLIDLLHTLGMKNLFKPGYGAAAFIELHKIKGEHYVKIIYSKTYDTKEFLSLEMKDQTNFLPTLEDFIIAMENYVPKNWDRECQLK